MTPAAKDAAMKFIISDDGGKQIPFKVVVAVEKKTSPMAARRLKCLARTWSFTKRAKRMASECLNLAVQLVAHPVVGEPEPHFIPRHRPVRGRRHWLWNLRPAPQPHFQGIQGAQGGVL